MASESIFAQATGRVIECVEDLRERQLTPGSVKNWLELVKHAWGHFDFAFPHYESSAQCQARMVRTLRHLGQRQAGTVLLVSSHGNAIALYLHATGTNASHSCSHAVGGAHPCSRPLVGGG